MRTINLRLIKTISFFLIVIIALWISACSDRTPPTFERVYGGNKIDVGNVVRQTPDGGYFIAGYTQSFGRGGEDFYFIRINEEGDTLWTKSYGGSGDEDDAWAAVNTPDGGFAIAGFGNSWSDKGDLDICLIKINAQGKKLWEQTYGNKGNDYSWDLLNTSDGGFLIVAQEGQKVSDDEDNETSDVLLIRTDAKGDTIWTRKVGGRGIDRCFSARQMPDGDFIVGGVTNSFGGGDTDILLFRTNSDGEVIWTRTYGGKGNDIGHGVELADDGGILVIGYTNSLGAGKNNVYLVRTNSNGDTLWTKTIGGVEEDRALMGQRLTDDGFIIIGYTQSYGAGDWDVYLIRIDKRGNTIWTRTYGGEKLDAGTYVQVLKDGGFAITGYSESFGTGGRDVYFIKTDSNGEVQK